MSQRAGFYGKMPCRGDFVSRGLPRALIDGFDRWFQQGMGLSRTNLGDDWNHCYGIAPIWRFYIASGVFDQYTWLGVFIPSIDKVGRQFPCLIAVPVDQRIVTYEQILAQELVFQRIEDLLLDSLELDFNFDHFCQQVEQLAVRSVAPPAELRADCGELPMGKNVYPMRFQYQHLDLLTALQYPVLWMSEGTEGIEPQMLLSQGLPEPDAFNYFISGDVLRKEVGADV